jgi:uracil-DNA glycosylase
MAQQNSGQTPSSSSGSFPQPTLNPRMEKGWKAALSEEFYKPYMADIKAALLADHEADITVYPPAKLLFHAFDATPFDQVKVVILGQDPYHGPGQAHGLSFSVPAGVAHPPSLQNIFKEVRDDVGAAIPASGDLNPWAKQGVLLLNSMLSVRAHEAASHAKIGWQEFTDAAISRLSEWREGIVFLLWGRFAQNKAALIDASRHHILRAPHPSPLSAHRGFFGSKPFSGANKLLLAQGLEPIEWDLNKAVS